MGPADQIKGVAERAANEWEALEMQRAPVAKRPRDFTADGKAVRFGPFTGHDDILADILRASAFDDINGLPQ